MHFDSLVDLFECFIPRLSNLYDENCIKLNPNELFAGIPALENSTTNINEIIRQE